MIVVGLMVVGLVNASEFKIKGSMIYDEKTELSWQKKPSSKKMTWLDAKNYCESMELRMPNLYELKSLVDYAKYNPAIRTDLIDIETDDYYWTSSPYVGKSDNPSAWLVYFYSGDDYWSNKTYTLYVLCVSGQ